MRGWGGNYVVHAVIVDGLNYPDHLSILTNKWHTCQIISFCLVEVYLIYTHDSEMYLSSTDLFAPCPGSISFKGASSTHVVLWNLSAKLWAFISMRTPITLPQSTQGSPIPHYWVVPMSPRPDTNNRRWDHSITLQGDILSITQSGQRGLNWNGRRDLDPLIN